MGSKPVVQSQGTEGAPVEGLQWRWKRAVAPVPLLQKSSCEARHGLDEEERQTLVEHAQQQPLDAHLHPTPRPPFGSAPAGALWAALE